MTTANGKVFLEANRRAMRRVRLLQRFRRRWLRRVLVISSAGVVCAALLAVTAAAAEAPHGIHCYGSPCVPAHFVRKSIVGKVYYVLAHRYPERFSLNAEAYQQLFDEPMPLD